MILSWFLALALGGAAGYALERRAAGRRWRLRLEQARAALQAELAAAQGRLQALRQDNADLRYQLGESEKTRRYLESMRQDPAQRGDTP